MVTVTAVPGHGEDREQDVSYTDVKVIGKGTFGVVYRAKLCSTGEMVAIKKVFHNEKFKNRELQMMRLLDHPNVITLHYFFYSNRPGYKKDEVFLNMVMEFFPETLWSVAQCDGTNKPLLEPLYVKVYMYQLFRCLAYLHSLRICHRDIKPQNLLLNPETNIIKLCDFGSAKELLKGESNVAYICSRYYRAPELILGATDYTLQIDVWSAGCVLAELLLGQPIFPGATAADQLVEIIKVLGTPTAEDFAEINRNFQNFNFPYLRPQEWPKVLNKHTTTPDAVDLVSRILTYTPSTRMSAIEVIAHPFFDELRQPHTRLHHGRRLPPLFNFTPEELQIRPDLKDRLVPAHVEDADAFASSPNSTGLDDLEEHTNQSLTLGAEHETSAGLIGKFRSSLKKKISIKGLASIAKSPSKSAGMKKEQTDGEEHFEEHPEDGHEVDVNTEGSPDNFTEMETEQQMAGEIDTSAVACTLSYEDTPDGAASKKKKKKKKPKTAATLEPEEITESTPVRYAAAVGGPLDLDESPVVVTEDTENGKMTTSYVHTEVTTETVYSADGEENQVVVKKVKTKKTKRKAEKKRVEDVEDPDAV